MNFPNFYSPISYSNIFVNVRNIYKNVMFEEGPYIELMSTLIIEVHNKDLWRKLCILYILRTEKKRRLFICSIYAIVRMIMYLARICTQAICLFS